MAELSARTQTRVPGWWHETAAGAADVEAYRRCPACLPGLRLATWSDTNLRGRLLRRGLLWLRVPPGLLGLLASLLNRSRMGPEARAFVIGYAYWRGVRRSVDRDTWARLTHAPVILMYHALSRNGASSRHILPQRRFARQMAWLRRGRRAMAFPRRMVSDPQRAAGDAVYSLGVLVGALRWSLRQ